MICCIKGTVHNIKGMIQAWYTALKGRSALLKGWSTAFKGQSAALKVYFIWQCYVKETVHSIKGIVHSIFNWLNSLIKNLKGTVLFLTDFTFCCINSMFSFLDVSVCVCVNVDFKGSLKLQSSSLKDGFKEFCQKFDIVLIRIIVSPSPQAWRSSFSQRSTVPVALSRPETRPQSPPSPTEIWWRRLSQPIRTRWAEPPCCFDEDVFQRHPDLSSYVATVTRWWLASIIRLCLFLSRHSLHFIPRGSSCC